MGLRLGVFLWIGVRVAFGAQAPASPPPEATFQTGVKLVQVSVIAQDQQGKPVSDLRREEFQILDNGSPQEIRLFLSATERPGPTPLEPKAPNTFTNQAGSPEGSRSGYSVIAFDTLSTELADESQGGSGTIWVKGKALQMLQTLPPDDNIAIYATGKKLEVIREFTRDRDSLARQLRTWRPSVDTPKIGIASCNGMPDHAIGDCVRQDTLRRIAGTGDEIAQVADHFAGIPGRKNLIWVAYQFPFRPADVQKLKNADIAIYPVDAHGSVIGMKSEKSDLTSPLRALANSTGGVAYSDRDDLDVAIREALEDGRVSYTLGYYPAGDDGGVKTHQLAVLISRPGVLLRYRNSYQPEASRPVSANPKDELKQALNRPGDTTTIPIKASVTRAPGNKPDRLSLEATLDVASLDLMPNQNRWTGKIEVAARFTAADGTVAGEVLAQTMILNLRQATYDRAVSGGFNYHNELKIPAKAVELKLMFANPASGKIGTLTIPLTEIGK